MDFFAEFFNVLFYTLWIIIVISFFFLLFRIVADVFRDETSRGVAKAAWLIFIIFFPIFGALVYLLAKGKGMAERQAQDAKAMRAAQVQYTKGLMSEAGPAGEIKAAKELLDSGAITQAEFDALKSKVLS
jgi:uncharacterized membrane protein